MKNGKYELIKAPKGFPGKIYRGKYAYEHRVVWWQMTGELPEIVHHKNGNKRDNRFENLEGMSEKRHRELHGEERSRIMLRMVCPACGRVFIRVKNKSHLKKPNKASYCSRKCVGDDSGDTYEEVDQVIEEFEE